MRPEDPAAHRPRHRYTGAGAEPGRAHVRHREATLGRLPSHGDHRDPFDHLLTGQAIAERLTLVSADPNADRYGAALLRC